MHDRYNDAAPGVPSAQERGREAEQRALRLLERRGLRLLEANYRCRWGEIDLVMRDGETLVFVEVRYRRNRAFGGALESVSRAKQTRLIAAARHYLQARRTGDAPARFDVVALEDDGTCEWVSDAFEAP